MNVLRTLGLSLLFVITVHLSGCNQYDSEVDTAFIEAEYLDDARKMYAREIHYDTTHPNFNDPVLNADEVDKILQGIKAVYTRNTHRTRFLFDEFQVRTYNYELRKFVIFFGDDFQGVNHSENFERGVAITGNPDLDAIFREFGVSLYETENPRYEPYGYEFVVPDDMNLGPITRRIAEIPGIIDAWHPYYFPVFGGPILSNIQFLYKNEDLYLRFFANSRRLQYRNSDYRIEGQRAIFLGDTGQDIFPNW